MNSLFELGFTPSQLADVDLSVFLPGRVIEEQKHAFRVWTENGLIWARTAGRLRHVADETHDRSILPAVGDFVLLRREFANVYGQDGWQRIETILTRRSCLRRKTAGLATTEQIIATNVDIVFLLNSLNRDLNERRLERYLLLAWDGGAIPVILLSKADLLGDRAEALRRLTQVAMGARVIPVSALSGEGLDLVRQTIGPGRTAVMLGSSGVGKSTLMNALLGQNALATNAVREDDDKGRHTTTHRSLWQLPEGGLLIDTPGMRELMPMANSDAIEGVFVDVELFAAACRFSDCGHTGEPGCAVEAALMSGDLPRDRFSAWQKALKEQAYLARKTDARLAAEERRKWKNLTKEFKRRGERKDGR